MIDVTRQVDAVSRQVGRRAIDAGEARTVTLSQVFDAGIDDVWDACTNAERLPRWFLPVTGDLHVGGRYQLEGNAGGTIERCEPPNGFAATWEFGDSISWITVRLSAEPGGRTRLELEHLASVGDDAHWDQYGPGATGVGWDLALVGLGLHLPSGAAVDRGAVESWSASADGISFMTLSSQRWAEADVAGGADEIEAKAAGDRTLAAYTAIPEEPTGD